MANQTKNFVDTMMDTQKNMVDTLVENTKKVANGNTMVNETVEKGSQWYKNWLEEQKNTFAKTTDKTANMTNNLQDNLSKMNASYQEWYNNQVNAAKQMGGMNQNWFQNMGNTSTNPMDMFNNMSSQWTNWMNNMKQTNDWMNNMNQWNNMFNPDSFKTNTENFTGVFNQYYEMLNGHFAKWQESISNGTAQDVYKNMINATEGFTRFSEILTPMWKSIQEKTFNMDVYKQWMNADKYKEMMDQFFGFMPEGSRNYMQQMNTMMQDQMKQFGQGGMNSFNQMRNSLNSMMPVNASEIFGNMMNGYNQFYSSMENAAAPFTKMIGANQYTRTIEDWKEIANRATTYQIKNAELQYMVYTQGSKVMDKLAESIMNKIENGTEVNSMMALYQEWMNISDKSFVSLFEGDEYSKLMAEVSALQLKLRKDTELQMEKMMTGVPVATRSEMDELYKTIYDLKKQVRQMEKMMDIDTVETTEEEPKATAKKTKKA